MTMRQPRHFAQFLSNQAGIAAVEFALIVPIMLLTYLGATDLTQALAIDRKLGQVASTVSDLVAQEETITEAQVQAFFDAGIAIMRPFDFDKTKLRLTIVKVEDSSATVTGATGHNWTIELTNGDDFTLADDMLALSDGRYVVVANAAYDYKPTFSTIFDATMGLEQRSMHLVRHEVGDDFGFTAGGSGSTAPGTGTGGESGGTGGSAETGGNTGGSDGSSGAAEPDPGEDGNSCMGYNCDDDSDDDHHHGGGGHGGGRGGRG